MGIAVELTWSLTVFKVSPSIEQVTLLRAKLIELLIHFVALPFCVYESRQN